MSSSLTSKVDQVASDLFAVPELLGHPGSDPTTAPSSEADYDPDLVSAAELARLCGRGLRTLTNWDDTGAIHPVMRRGRRYYRLSEVLSAIANGIPGVNPRNGSIIKQLAAYNSRDT